MNWMTALRPTDGTGTGHLARCDSGYVRRFSAVALRPTGAASRRREQGPYDPGRDQRVCTPL